MNKIHNIINNKFKGNDDTDYGNFYEPFGRNKYCEEKNVNVMKVGIVVHSFASIFGFSPDGLTDSKILLEIKCPKIGESLSAYDCLGMLPYIANINNEYILREKHAYYGQVQLGMALLNVDTCHFIIYASFDNSIAIITVKLDEPFLKKLLVTLANIFFTYYLPYLSE